MHWTRYWKIVFYEILKLKLYSDLVFLATWDADLWSKSHWLQASSQVQVPISKSQVKSQVQKLKSQVKSQVAKLPTRVKSSLKSPTRVLQLCNFRPEISAWVKILVRNLEKRLKSKTFPEISYRVQCAVHTLCVLCFVPHVFLPCRSCHMQFSAKYTGTSLYCSFWGP